MLADGTGGVHWAGLDFAVELFGVEDVEGLLHRLLAIKQHAPPAGDAPQG